MKIFELFVGKIKFRHPKVQNFDWTIYYVNPEITTTLSINYLKTLIITRWTLYYYLCQTDNKNTRNISIF